MDPALERQIRDGYALFLSGDMDAVLREFAPDATFTNPPYAVEGGTRQGTHEVRAGFQALQDQFEFDAIDVLELVEGPDGVLAIVSLDARGRTSGAPLQGRFFHRWRLRDGKVTDFAWFSGPEEARAATGLD